MTDLILTQEQKDLFTYMKNIIADKKNYTYDFTDPKQYLFAELMNKLGGLSAEDYPGFYNMLKIRKSEQEKNIYLDDKNIDDSGFKDNYRIYYIKALHDQKLAFGSGFGTVVEGFNSLSLSMVIMDESQQKILAHGGAVGYHGVYLSLNTQETSAKPIEPKAIAILHFSGQKKDGTPIPAGITTQVYEVNYVTDIKLIDPMRKAPGKPYNQKAVNIGLGRDWGNREDMDYVFNEKTTDKPIGKIPFVGNATFQYPICQLKPQENFSIEINVINVQQGGQIEMNPENMQEVYSRFSIDSSNPCKLNWNLCPPTETGEGHPITFHEIMWPTDVLAWFKCTIFVTLQIKSDIKHAWVDIVSSDFPSPKPQDGTLFIMPLEFVWHCLGAGTLVTLSDNKNKKEIEKFLKGDTVLTDNNGKTEIISSTFKGNHSGAVLQINTDEGHDLIISGKHVVMTPAGAVYADELRIGDKIVVMEGIAKISSITKIDKYDDLLYNLCVGEYKDYEDSNGNINTFFANGILVGDICAQRALKYQRSNDIDYLKRTLGEFWFTDIESYFKKKAYN